MIQALPQTRAIKKLTVRFPGLTYSAAVFAAYAIWSTFFKFVSLSFVTYFVLSSAGSESSHFEDVNEALNSSQLSMLALCAASFIVLFRLFQPLLDTGHETRPVLVRWKVLQSRFKPQFIPGFLHGAILAIGVTMAFLIGGVYRYLGFFIQTETAPLAFAGIIVRVSSILIFVYFEEFIFRQTIQRALLWRERLPDSLDEIPPRTLFWNNIGAMSFVSLLFVVTKLYQFDIGWMQGITVFLISFALCLRALLSADFLLGAGFWSAVLIVFQSLLSLPILGHEFSGFLMVKYQAVPTEVTTQFFPPESTSSDTLRFITGGPGGPLAGFAFQILIFLDVVRGALRYRRKLVR